MSKRRRRRGSSAGSPLAIPNNIQERLRFNPAKWANFPSLGSGDETGRMVGISGRNAVNHSANSGGVHTRRIKSASARHGDRKSSPDGSKAIGPLRSPL